MYMRIGMGIEISNFRNSGLRSLGEDFEFSIQGPRLRGLVRGPGIDFNVPHTALLLVCSPP